MEQLDLGLCPTPVPAPRFAPGQTVRYYRKGVTLFEGRVITVTAATHGWEFSEWQYYVEGDPRPVAECDIRPIEWDKPEPEPEPETESGSEPGHCQECGKPLDGLGWNIIERTYGDLIE